MDAETKQKTKQTDRGEKTSFLSPRNKQIIISSNFNKNFWVINLLLLAGTRVRGKNKMFMMWFWLRCKKLFFWRNKKLKSTKLMMMMKNIELNLIQCKSQKSVRRRKRRKNLKLKNQMSHLKLCYSFNCVFREHHYSFLLLRNSNWRQRQRIKSKNSKLFMIFIIRIMMIMMIITRKKWMNEWGERRKRGEQKKNNIHFPIITSCVCCYMMCCDYNDNDDDDDA